MSSKIEFQTEEILPRWRFVRVKNSRYVTYFIWELARYLCCSCRSYFLIFHRNFNKVSIVYLLCYSFKNRLVKCETVKVVQ